jgi:hypothetical protein
LQRGIEGTGGGYMRLEPGRRRSHPVANGLGRAGMGQLVQDSGGNDNLLEQGRKNLNLSDEHEVMDRTRVGDDDVHRYYNPRLRKSRRSRSKSSSVGKSSTTEWALRNPSSS